MGASKCRSMRCLLACPTSCQSHHVHVLRLAGWRFTEKGWKDAALYGNLSIQRNTAGSPFTIVVVSTHGGEFDTNYGVWSQAFNENDGIERLAATAITLTRNQ